MRLRDAPHYRVADLGRSGFGVLRRPDQLPEVLIEVIRRMIRPKTRLAGHRRSWRLPSQRGRPRARAATRPERTAITDLPARCRDDPAIHRERAEHVMAIESVWCPVCHAGVNRVTNLEGEVRAVNCSQYRQGASCALKAVPRRWAALAAARAGVGAHVGPPIDTMRPGVSQR